MTQRVRTWRRPGASGTLYRGDAAEFLGSLRTGSVDLLFLDPPFNLRKIYSLQQPKLDARPPRQYERWLRMIAREAARVVAPGGALYLYHLPRWALTIGADLQRDLVLRHWIAIAMKNGFARGERLYPAHYALLYFTKGPPAHFVRPKLRPQRCRKCKEFVKDYGGYRKIVETKGLNLSDIWDDVSPLRHRNRKHRNANELPSVITDRIVQISGVPDGFFVDPFAGAGSSIISAIAKGMRFRACDIVQENCTIIADRVNSFKAEARAASANRHGDRHAIASRH